MSFLITLAVFVVILNVLDSVTTEIALYKLPTDIRAKESNPIMAWGMRRSRILPIVIKHISVLALVIFLVATFDSHTLKFLLIGFGIVVLSNSYTVIARLLTRKDVDSLLGKLTRLCHIPEKLSFLMVIVVILGLAYCGVRLWN